MSKGDDPEDLSPYMTEENEVSVTTQPRKVTVVNTQARASVFDEPTEPFVSEEEEDEEDEEEELKQQIVDLASLHSAQVVFKDGQWIDTKTNAIVRMSGPPGIQGDDTIPVKVRRQNADMQKINSFSDKPVTVNTAPALMVNGMAVSGSALYSSQVATSSEQKDPSSEPMGFEAFIAQAPTPPATFTKAAVNLPTVSKEGVSALEFATGEAKKKRKKRSTPLKRSASSSVSSQCVEEQQENDVNFSAEWVDLIDSKSKTADKQAKVWLGMEVKRYTSSLLTHVQYGSGRRSQVAAHFFNVLFRLYLDIGDVNSSKQRNAYTDLTLDIADRVVRAVCAIANTQTPIDQFAPDSISQVRSNAAFLNATDLSDMEREYLQWKLDPTHPSYQQFATVFASFCNIAVVQKRYVIATLLAYSLFCICKVVDICTDSCYLQDEDDEKEREVSIPSAEFVTHSVVKNCHVIMDLLLLQRLSGGDKGLIDEAKASGLSQSVNNFIGRNNRRPTHTQSIPALLNEQSALFKSLHNQQAPATAGPSQHRNPTQQLANALEGVANGTEQQHQQEGGGGCVIV